ncbi:hypothetical protein [Plantactinospora sp. B5E13]|uniref:hypothetical protein n=1 Tax=unclassified Plantactinospora TaxID=2631981 RepID=UPI00325CB47A
MTWHRSPGPSRRLLVFLAIGALGLAAGTPAGAAPVGKPDTPRQLVSAGSVGATDVERAQAPLVALSDRIQEQVAKQRLPGFAGVAVDIPARQVILYWKGDVPASLTTGAMMAKGVRLATVSVPYSLAELDREARRIAEQNQATVASVAPRTDFTGLTVALDRAASAGLATSSAIASEIPLTFTTTSRPEPAVNRWADEVPYWSGNAIERPAGTGRVYRCSTAFAARTTTNQNVMVTSNHCGTFAEWDTPGGWRVGTSGRGHAPLDSMLISGSYYDLNMYVGDYQSNTGVPIYGAGNPALNSWVFASGSHSGASVVGVGAVNVYINLNGVGTVGPGFYTVNTDGVASIGQGDSGGPVAQAVAANGGTAIYGRGVITAGTPSTTGACQGVQNRQCYTQAFHVNIYDIMAYWGIMIGSSGGV